MLYVIKGKPYVKVADYYKEVEVKKNGNEYSVKPYGGKETRVYAKHSEVLQMSVSDFYKKYSTKGLNEDKGSKSPID